MMEPSLYEVCIPTGATLRRAMEAIDDAGSEIALLVDEDDRLVAVLTDGDIRRALLRNATLADAALEHASREFVATGTLDRAAALEFMQARDLAELPVVDPHGRVVGLHRLRSILGVAPRTNAAVILAGGRGVRLGALTRELPKPMVPVAGRPILERIVLHLVGAGVTRIYLAVNYLAERIEEHFGDGHELGASIEYLREDPSRPLGTAGALGLLPRSVRIGDTPILVMNGDLVTRFSVDELCAVHAREHAAITVGVSEHRYEVPYGVVEIDGPHVVGLDEKPPRAWLVNAGVYAVAPDIAARVGPGEELSMPHLVAECLAKEETIAACRVGDDWLDIGTPETLRTARGETA
jgi:dTDP-glucose pyrophosphorylase